MKAILEISACRHSLASLLLFVTHMASLTATARRIATTLLVVTAFSWTGPSFASVYRCVGADGNATYSDNPCGSNSEKVDVQVPPPSAPSNPSPLGGDDNSVQHNSLEARTRSQRQAGVVQCETAKFNAWVRQQVPMPDKETRLAKFKSLQDDCRQSFHFAEEDVAAYQSPANTGARTITNRAVMSSGSDLAIGRSETHQIASVSGSGKLLPDSVRRQMNAASEPESEIQKMRGGIVVQCTTDQYKAWLKSQGSPPDMMTWIAKLPSANRECLAHIPDSATPIFGPDGLPTIRMGQWSISIREGGAKSSQKHSTMCVDAQTSKSMTAASKQLTEAFGCTRQHKLDANHVTMEANCKLGDSNLLNHTVDTFFGDAAYHEETKTIVEPTLNGIASVTSSTDAYWVGSCPEGMKATYPRVQ